MSTTQKNGAAVAPKTETAQTGNIIVKNGATPAEAPKANAPGEKPEAPKFEPLTIEQQQAKARQLQQLFERRAKIIDTRDTLEEFVLSTDGQTNKLVLDDGKGQVFKTSSPAVIEHVLGLVKTIVAGIVVDTDKQILSI